MHTVTHRVIITSLIHRNSLLILHPNDCSNILESNGHFGMIWGWLNCLNTHSVETKTPRPKLEHGFPYQARERNLMNLHLIYVNIRDFWTYKIYLRSQQNLKTRGNGINFEVQAGEGCAHKEQHYNFSLSIATVSVVDTSFSSPSISTAIQNWVLWPTSV